MRGVRSLIGLVALLACATSNSNRVGLQQPCDSDKDCLYGLVCRGAPVNQPGQRACVFTEYDKCTSSSQCLPGRICRAGACTVQCLRDADCIPLNTIRGIGRPDAGPVKEDEFHCVVGECHTGESDSSCATAADCSPGEDCSAGRCVQSMRTHCENDIDCESGERCIGHVCQ